MVIKALEFYQDEDPRTLNVGMIGHYCRRFLKIRTVLYEDSITLVNGLQIIVPDLIGIDDKEKSFSMSALLSALQPSIPRLKILYGSEKNGK